jgi:hypothetical protein
MGELTIRYKVLRASTVVSYGTAGALFVALVVYQPGAWPTLLGLVLVFLIVCLRARSMLLEVTPTVVRARQGRVGGRPDVEAPRVEIYEIRYCPRRIRFMGPSGRSLMNPYPLWTLEQVIRVAEVLDVPVYDHRGRFRLQTLTREELAVGRLVKGDSSAGWW